jgi:hypothetical protein
MGVGFSSSIDRDETKKTNKNAGPPSEITSPLRREEGKGGRIDTRYLNRHGSASLVGSWLFISCCHAHDTSETSPCAAGGSNAVAHMARRGEGGDG